MILSNMVIVSLVCCLVLMVYVLLATSISSPISELTNSGSSLVKLYDSANPELQ